MIETLIFPHIPKAAGTSFGKNLAGISDHFLGVKWDKVQFSLERNIEKIHDIHLDKNLEEFLSNSVDKHLRVTLAGHFGYKNLNKIEINFPYKLISFLRCPKERAWSQYCYNSSEKHPPHADFKSKYPTFKDYLLKFHGKNPQSKQLIGNTTSAQESFDKIQKKYHFIGVTELYQESLDHLMRLLNINNIVEQVHVNKGRENKGSADVNVTDEEHEILNNLVGLDTYIYQKYKKTYSK